MGLVFRSVLVFKKGKGLELFYTQSFRTTEMEVLNVPLRGKKNRIGGGGSRSG